MQGNSRSPREWNAMMGSKNSIVGDVSNSQVNVVTGDGSQAHNSRGTDPWLTHLQTELTRIRGLLEEGHGPGISGYDRGVAMGAVTAVEDDLPAAPADNPVDRERLRKRVGRLIGALAPFAEVIGGVAALEAILQHL